MVGHWIISDVRARPADTVAYLYSIQVTLDFRNSTASSNGLQIKQPDTLHWSICTVSHYICLDMTTTVHACKWVLNCTVITLFQICYIESWLHCLSGFFMLVLEMLLYCIESWLHCLSGFFMLVLEMLLYCIESWLDCICKICHAVLHIESCCIVSVGICYAVLHVLITSSDVRAPAIDVKLRLNKSRSSKETARQPSAVHLVNAESFIKEIKNTDSALTSTNIVLPQTY